MTEKPWWMDSKRLKRGFSTISSIVPLKAARSQGECELLPLTITAPVRTCLLVQQLTA